MGKPSANALDQVRALVSGSFTVSGTSASAVFTGRFNLSVWGTFNATLVLERSFNVGETWLPLSVDPQGTAVSLTGPCSLMIQEPEGGVLYRLRTSAFTSGTVNYRISQ